LRILLHEERAEEARVGQAVAEEHGLRIRLRKGRRGGQGEGGGQGGADKIHAWISRGGGIASTELLPTSPRDPVTRAFAFKGTGIPSAGLANKSVVTGGSLK
jgi:hypothetical protein